VRTFRFALIGAAVAAPAAAQPVQFSAVASSEIGYAVNPFLAPGVTEGTMLASASIEPRLFYQDARSTTTVQGKYNRETYLHDFGHSDSGAIGLIRTDMLSQFLTSTVSANYSTTNQATINDPSLPLNDPLDIGRRTRTLTGSYQLQWQATARDQLSYGAQATHVTYGSRGDTNVGLGALASGYTQYAVNAGYNRVLDARTTVGAQVSLSSTRSSIYPDSRVIQPSLTAKRQLNAVWEIDGHVGVVFQHIEGPFASSTTSLGAGLNLCGAYPRTRICFQASHDTQPSGYGSLRKETSITVHLNHELDAHSRVTLNAQYLKDSGGGFPTVAGNLLVTNTKAVLASAEYDHDLTQRVSAGFGGRFQQRDLNAFPTGRSYSGSIHVKAKLGRM
jgi:hypothetical protein